jgi:hypothetical protein
MTTTSDFSLFSAFMSGFISYFTLSSPTLRSPEGHLVNLPNSVSIPDGDYVVVPRGWQITDPLPPTAEAAWACGMWARYLFHKAAHDLSAIDRKAMLPVQVSSVFTFAPYSNIFWIPFYSGGLFTGDVVSNVSDLQTVRCVSSWMDTEAECRVLKPLLVLMHVDVKNWWGMSDQPTIQDDIAPYEVFVQTNVEYLNNGDAVIPGTSDLFINKRSCNLSATSLTMNECARLSVCDDIRQIHRERLDAGKSVKRAWPVVVLKYLYDACDAYIAMEETGQLDDDTFIASNSFDLGWENMIYDYFGVPQPSSKLTYSVEYNNDRRAFLALCNQFMMSALPVYGSDEQVYTIVSLNDGENFMRPYGFHSYVMEVYTEHDVKAWAWRAGIVGRVLHHSSDNARDSQSSVSITALD